MTILWLVQRRTKNAGIVDVAWSLGVGVLGVFFALLAGGYGPRRFLVAALAAIWSLRLGLYILKRVTGETEDARYTSLREKWGEKTQVYLFVFFQVQAFWGVLFAIPMLLAARNAVPSLGVFDMLGALVWVVAVTGEAIADRQLARFRSDPSNRGQVCREGLWRYSRHPNYFFEWVHWWAYVLIGWQAPHGWLTLFGPALMLLFITRVTGIPPTEERALQSRGDAYREYQRTTSAFFPWPPKE
jgi:steroid 5-alpha reductase family enzyme